MDDASGGVDKGLTNQIFEHDDWTALLSYVSTLMTKRAPFIQSCVCNKELAA